MIIVKHEEKSMVGYPKETIAFSAPKAFGSLNLDAFTSIEKYFVGIEVLLKAHHVACGHPEVLTGHYSALLLALLGSGGFHLKNGSSEGSNVAAPLSMRL